jgi:hypothetical protein
VNLYETMVWLSRVVRQTYPSRLALQSDAVLTETISSYEKHKCSLLTKIEHLKPNDDRHPVKLMETRYKRLFEKVYFHEIPLRARKQCLLYPGTEADIKADRDRTYASSQPIGWEAELQRYYSMIILDPAVVMAETVLRSKECPKELEGVLGPNHTDHMLDIRIPENSTVAPAPDREIALSPIGSVYDRKRDVALPAKVKLPIVLNSNTRTAIRGLADEKQDGWIIGLQNADRGEKDKSAARIAVQVAPLDPTFHLLIVLCRFSPLQIMSILRIVCYGVSTTRSLDIGRPIILILST